MKEGADEPAYLFGMGNYQRMLIPLKKAIVKSERKVQHAWKEKNLYFGERKYKFFNVNKINSYSTAFS